MRKFGPPKTSQVTYVSKGLDESYPKMCQNLLAVK